MQWPKTEHFSSYSIRIFSGLTDGTVPFTGGSCEYGARVGVLIRCDGKIATVTFCEGGIYGSISFLNLFLVSTCFTSISSNALLLLFVYFAPSNLSNLLVSGPIRGSFTNVGKSTYTA